jgi:hypothetical protein
MPFIPNDKIEVGQWMYLKVPVRVNGGVFTAGTRVLIESQIDEAYFTFYDEHGNKSDKTPIGCFTRELQ